MEWRGNRGFFTEDNEGNEGGVWPERSETDRRLAVARDNEGNKGGTGK